MKFFGPPAFAGVIARYDVGAGDRLYDHPDAYRLPWAQARKSVTKSLIVVTATKGALGQVSYKVEEIADDGSVTVGSAETVSQADFAKMIEVLEQ